MPQRSKLLPIGFETNWVSSIGNMEAIQELLNPPTIWRPKEYPAIRKELARLVDLWFNSGPNLYKLLDENPELKQKLLHGSAVLIPTSSGRAYIDFLHGSPKLDLRRPQNVALRYFSRLITNPEWELLGKCSRCNEYFLKRTKKQKVYCSTTCGTRTTAALAMKAKRQTVRAEKIRRARESVKKWVKRKSKDKWQTWVARETGYTPRFLTRAAKELGMVKRRKAKGLQARPEHNRTANCSTPHHGKMNKA